MKFSYRAIPDATHLYGVVQLDRHGSRLVTDAGYFPSRAQAEAWAASRGWVRYELTEVVGGVSEQIR